MVIYEAFVEWRQLVPTAKRVIAAHWSRFLADAEIASWPRPRRNRRAR